MNVLKKILLGSWVPDEIVTVILGNKRAGKSTTGAKIAYACKCFDIPVYSNYPVKYCTQLPLIKDKYGRVTLNKEAFYQMELENCVLIIDECAGIWNARSFTNFREEDSNFFQFLGHRNVKVVLIAQYWDTIDLNLKRHCGKIWFIRKGRFGFSKIEVTDVETDKVRNLEESVDRKGYDVYEFKIVMSDRFFKKRIWRPRWYNNFDSYYLDQEYIKLDLPNWSNLVEFPKPTKFYNKILKS